MKLISKYQKIITIILIISISLINCQTKQLPKNPEEDCNDKMSKDLQANDKFIFNGCKQLSPEFSYSSITIDPKDLDKSYFLNEQKYAYYKASGCSDNYKQWYDSKTPSGATNPLLFNLKSYLDDCEYKTRLWNDIKDITWKNRISACVDAFIKVTPPPFCWLRIFELQECGYMKKCGPLACAQSTATCAATIGLMTMKTGKFLLDLGLTVSSGGFYRSFKSTLMAYVGTQFKDYTIPLAMHVAQSALEEFLNKSDKNVKQFKERMLEEAKKVDNAITMDLVELVFEQLKPKKKSTKENAIDFVSKLFDYFKTGGFDTTGVSALKGCGTINTSTDKVNCLKALLGIVGTLDPSGIVTLVTAFIYPQCPRTQRRNKIRKLF